MEICNYCLIVFEPSYKFQECPLCIADKRNKELSDEIKRLEAELNGHVCIAEQGV